MKTKADIQQAQDRPSSNLQGPVLIIGAGLMGSSIGLALRAQGIETVLDDVSSVALNASVGIGAGRALTAADKEKSNAVVSGRPFGPQLVIVAAPPKATPALVIRALSDWPESVVADVASVKSSVIAGVVAAKSYGGMRADISRYVGSHPMAGRERRGAAAARRDLFLSRPWVIVPAEAAGTIVSSPEAIEVVEKLVADCKAVPVRMGPPVHDQAAALVSHAPQVVASLMAARLHDVSSEALALTGQGLRDVTRIAGSDPQLWVQILVANAQSLVGVLSAMRNDLDKTIAALKDAHTPEAEEVIRGLLSAGNSGQARIPAKHGGVATTAFTAVRVLVDDAVGQISTLLADIESLGVNLEDLRVEHAQGRPVGVVEVVVVSAKAAMVAAALESEERGSRAWTVLQ